MVTSRNRLAQKSEALLYFLGGQLYFVFFFSFNLQSLVYMASINVELKQLELYKNLVNEGRRRETRYELKKACNSLADKYQDSEFVKVIVLACNRFT